MKIVAVPIPDGSHGLRVFRDKMPEDHQDGDPYDFTCNLCHIDRTTCEVTHAMGDLDNEVAIGIGIKAIDLGYKRLRFERSMGGLATRWAKFDGTKKGMDHYSVDLQKALAILKQRKGC